jgi:hypothetical protein
VEREPLISVKSHEQVSYFQELFSVSKDRVLGGLYEKHIPAPLPNISPSDTADPEVKECT